MQQVTLQAHDRYSREEVLLAALDWASLTRKPSSFVAGVVWSDPHARRLLRDAAQDRA